MPLWVPEMVAKLNNLIRKYFELMPVNANVMFKYQANSQTGKRVNLSNAQLAYLGHIKSTEVVEATSCQLPQLP